MREAVCGMRRDRCSHRAWLRSTMPCFFSSRRRHTRSDRDWSSDVCSSDLLSSDSGFAGDIQGTAFSGEGDAADQTHLYLGIALGPFKNLSAGAKLGAISDSSQLSAILIDLNGDGLLDQVMVNGSSVTWVQNTGTPGAPSFSTA